MPSVGSLVAITTISLYIDVKDINGKSENMTRVIRLIKDSIIRTIKSLPMTDSLSLSVPAVHLHRPLGDRLQQGHPIVHSDTIESLEDL